MVVSNSNTTNTAPATIDTTSSPSEKDLYEGHKVVAMPNSSFGGKTVRDVVSGRNTERRTDYRNRTPTRRRSGSLGKSPVSRSRDIVQDVYNRIGVDYIRGRPSIESLLDKESDPPPPILNDELPNGPTSRGRATLSSTDTRGRSDEGMAVERSRPRSLSRGRSVIARWPYDRQAAAAAGTNNSQSAGTALDAATPTSSAPPQMKARGNFRQRMSTPQPLNAGFGGSSSRSVDMKKRQSYHPDIRPPDMRDEQSDEAASLMKNRDMRELEELRDNISVKEMMSSYSGPSENKINTPPPVPSGRSGVRKTYNNQFHKRDHPPKVDIYEEAGASTTGSRDGSMTAREQQNKKRFSSSGNSVSARSIRSSHLAESFLAAISPNKQQRPGSPTLGYRTNIPLSGIPSGELNVPVDSASVAASSVSGEDFELSPRRRGGSGHVKSYSGGIAKYGGYNGNDKLLEKYVEDRVQVQVTNMAKSIEGRFEQKYKGRIEELERQVDSLSTLVSKLI